MERTADCPQERAAASPSKRGYLSRIPPNITPHLGRKSTQCAHPLCTVSPSVYRPATRIRKLSLELPHFLHRAVASARTAAMSFTTTGKTAPPQAFISSYAPRLRSYGNSLLSPIVPPSNTLPPPRTTKRGTAIISYAEDGYDDDFEDSDGPRRATGLRSIRRDDSNMDKSAQIAALGKELVAPVDIQGIWRDWMGRPKRTL
jgi:hypothetical protein